MAEPMDDNATEEAAVDLVKLSDALCENPEPIIRTSFPSAETRAKYPLLFPPDSGRYILPADLVPDDWDEDWNHGKDDV